MSDLQHLKWRCRRGVKELDVVFTRYLEDQFPTASEEEQNTFRELLQIEDPTLFGMLVGSEPIENPQHAALLEKMRAGL